MPSFSSPKCLSANQESFFFLNPVLFEREEFIFFLLFNIKDLINSVTKISRERTFQSVKNLIQISFPAFQILHTKHRNQFLTVQELFLN